MHGCLQPAMFAQRIGVQLTGENLAFLMSESQQGQKRLLYGLPIVDSEKGALLFNLESQASAWAAASITGRLQQDMLFLRERDDQVAVCFQAITEPARDIGFHL